MPTPARGYFLADGTKVPSVTTVIGRFKESGGLMGWAFKKGTEAGRVFELARARGEKPKMGRLYEASEDAKNIGTLAHAAVEDDIHGREIKRPEGVTDDIWSRVTESVGAYLDWKRRSKLVIIETEIELISEEFRYGGTVDALGHIGDEMAKCLPDWKTSNAIHSDYLVQIAAYGHLAEENGRGPLDGGYDLCRFSKEFGDFHHLHLNDLNDAWRAFVLMRELYDVMEVLDRRIA